jgi:methylmalonyl-CoA/ethylmalonyl-CoA epimerase
VNIAAQDLGERFGLREMDQISFPVADVDEAVSRYERVFGPFVVTEVPAMPITFHGKPSSMTLKLGFGHSGPIEVELVEVQAGDHPAVEHLATKGESIHHVRFPVDDLDSTQVAMEADGWVTTLAGGAGDVKFAYLEAPAVLGGTSIELIQMG